jgi:PKD repeat protein
MMKLGIRTRGTLPRLALALATGACDGADDLVVTDPSVPPTAESPPSGLVAVDGILAKNTYTGIPYGPSSLWTNTSTVKWGPAPFTSSVSFSEAAIIVRQIDAARALNQKLILNMTGGTHERYKTDSKFDLSKWKAVMNTYDTEQIKAAVLAGVEDGTLVMNSVMDEPQVTDWGGVMTKPLLDEMAAYVKNLFPTLPVGVVARWDWRPEERYQVIDAILAQYQWNKGSVTAYRDNVLAQAQREGIAVVFSMNILDGGIMSWKTKECPIPLTGGYGTKVPNCRMTADQVRDWGRLLGSAGCAMSMWRYDQTFMSKADNQQAFNDVAATLAAIPGRPCRRTAGGGTPPPPNTPPIAAFTPPTCTPGVACQFTDDSRDDDGTIAARSWDFGNGETSTARNPSATFATEGSYSVRLEVTDDAGATDDVSENVTVSPAASVAPAADFGSSCNGLTCTFTDQSTDPDGKITSWSWTFGDGATSTQRNPSRTYAAGGTYSVVLTITYDGGTDQHTAPVTVSAPATPIVLTVTGRTDATHQYMTLRWTGAKGASVAIYRTPPGRLWGKTGNDGQWTNSKALPGFPSYTYKVCQPNTSICSNEATVTFP